MIAAFAKEGVEKKNEPPPRFIAYQTRLDLPRRTSLKTRTYHGIPQAGKALAGMTALELCSLNRARLFGVLFNSQKYATTIFFSAKNIFSREGFRARFQRHSSRDKKEREPSVVVPLASWAMEIHRYRVHIPPPPLRRARVCARSSVFFGRTG